MQKKILLLLTFVSIHGSSYADNISYQFIDVQINTNKCEFINKNDLGICIKNNTGETMTEKNIEVWSYEVGTSDIRRIHFDYFYKDTYFVIQTSRKRLKDGDQTKSELTEKIGIAYPDFRPDICFIEWSYLSPPYADPVILALDKVGSEYKCRYELNKPVFKFNRQKN